MQWIDYIIWTDGGCDPNPGRGGWGAIIIKQRGGEREDIYGGMDNTTNNRMEMQAVIEGLKRTPEGSRVLVMSDSQVVVNGGNGEWKRKSNKDLWDIITGLMNSRRVDFKWIKGHADEPFNEAADRLAAAGIAGEANDTRI